MAQPISDDKQPVTMEPCPFCGKQPKSGDSSYGYWRVFCSDANDCAVAPKAEGSTEAEAITAWNTRPARAPQASGGVEKAREALQRAPGIVLGLIGAFRMVNNGPEAIDEAVFPILEEARKLALAIATQPSNTEGDS